MSKPDLLALALDALKLLCEADEVGALDNALFDRARDAIAALEAAQSQPVAPPECKTDEEKTAFAFGWWKALESVRAQPVAPDAPSVVMLGDELVQGEGSDYGCDDRFEGYAAPAVELPVVAWIPASERLPELDVPVLTMFDGNPHIWPMMRSDDGDGWLWALHAGLALDEPNNYEADDDYLVDYWMPLPLPPAAKQGGTA